MIRKLAQIFALFFIFTIPWENALSFGSLGSISRIIGLVAAGFWAVSVLLQNRLRTFRTSHIFIFIFLLFNVASLLWTVDFELTFGRVRTYLQMAIQIWMLWDLLDSEKLYRYALVAFLIGTFLTVASTFSNYISGQLISEWEYGRYSGGGQNAVELALILSLCFPVAWYLALSERDNSHSNLLKATYIFFIPAAFFALILTASRTAIFTIIPAALYIIGSLNRVRLVYRFLCFAVLILALLIGQSLVPIETLQRLGTIGSSIASGDLGGRMELWQKCLQIFAEHPLLGIGSGSLSAPDQLGAFTHNTFLSILTELGVVGFLIFLGLLVSVILQILRQPQPESALWLTILATWIIGVQSLTWEYTKPTWFFISMIAISAAAFTEQAAPAKSFPGQGQPGLPHITNTSNAITRNSPLSR